MTMKETKRQKKRGKLIRLRVTETEIETLKKHDNEFIRGEYSILKTEVPPENGSTSSGLSYYFNMIFISWSSLRFLSLPQLGLYFVFHLPLQR